MKIENQVCSPYQATKLMGLGIDTPSLHQWWKMKYPASEEAYAKNRANCLITPTGDSHDRFIMHYIDNENASFHWEEGTHSEGWDHSRCELEEGPLPAYNVAELGEMLPTGYDTMRITGYKPDQYFWKGFDIDDNPIGRDDYSTEAQCRAAMLIHLIESGLTSIQEINQRVKQTD